MPFLASPKLSAARHKWRLGATQPPEHGLSLRAVRIGGIGSRSFRAAWELNPDSLRAVFS